METTSALAVVPAGQVDTAGVVVALDQTLRTLVDIWGHTRRYQSTNITPSIAASFVFVPILDTCPIGFKCPAEVKRSA